MEGLIDLLGEKVPVLCVVYPEIQEKGSYKVSHGGRMDGGGSTKLISSFLL